MRVNILIGGKAGQGPNILTQILGETLVKLGYYVFYSRDYESLIRGGHNFNTLTFSENEVYSNDSKVDVLVALDELSVKKHRDKLNSSGLLITGENNDNMYFAGRLFKILGIDFSLLEEELKKLKNFERNYAHAKNGYEEETRSIKIEKKSLAKTEKLFTSGSKAIAEGAVKSGLEVYYAYPMTPATPVLMELGERKEKDNILVFELENEIAVANAAVASSAFGLKTMVGTSGGGFDLMTEAISFAAIAEVPFICYLSSRPGPGTGVATYTSQGDLNLARNFGHGEFFRLVVAPGDPVECEEKTSEAFYFSEKYGIPSIILNDKHCAESFFSLNEKSKITKSEKITKEGRYNSYERIETGEATENPEIIKKNFDKRMKKTKEIEKEAEKFEMFKIHGKKDSKNLIISYGSTKGAVLDAIKELNVKFLQIIYISPFSEKIENEMKQAKKIILIENSSTGMLGDLIREKTGIEIKEKILRYDGRPFFADELKNEIEKRLK